jgi:transposase
MWCIPPENDAEFVCAMENVLEVYKRPYDPQRPVVCFDEKSKQLVGEVATPIAAVPCRPVPVCVGQRDETDGVATPSAVVSPQPTPICVSQRDEAGGVAIPIAAVPGQVERCDYEYVRNGTANLFMLVEPLGGRRHVSVTERRTKLDFAVQMQQLVDVHYPQAEKITLVMDNLNTHRMSCLYEAFAPEQARRLIDKIEVVHTPKHGSWLNMAECELSVMEKQAISDRISDMTKLRDRIGFWESDRNSRTCGIDWQFTTSKARIKLRRLYPKIQLR